MSSSDINHAIAPAYVAATRDVRYHAIGCLTFLVWHCLLTLDSDVRYIWTMRNRNPFKWVYFFLRYVVILACVMHNWLIEPLADGSNPPRFCIMWSAYVIIFSQILACLLELIMATRIFALYNRSRSVAFVLSTLILAEFVGTVRILWLKKKIDFYQTCLLLQLTKNGRDQSILGLTVHCILVGLTLFKYFLAFRAGWNRAPLVSMVVRDSGTTYITIVLIVVLVMVLCDMENERSVALAFWIISLLSISGCRMILSMERLARGEIWINSLQPIFTSQLSLGPIDTGSGRQDQPPL